MARAVARELLDDLEGGGADISSSLMKAKRLARLLRDEDAQQWLDLEMKGYPDNFNFGSLGSCCRYALEGGRVNAEGRYYSQSLPRIEAEARAAESALSSQSVVDKQLAVENYTAAGATMQVLAGLGAQQAAIRSAYSNWAALLASMRAAVHSYASDSSLALELGDAAESIFEAARRGVDVFVRSNCPSAAQQLLAIAERLRDEDSESLSAALTSCRRLLVTVADAVFPARDEDYVDGSGKARKCGPDEYKNRLLAFVEQTSSSAGTRSLLSSDLGHLSARLDAVNDKACKGVHAEVTPSEARLVVIGTYVLVAEVARLAAGTTQIREPAPELEPDGLEIAGGEG